MTWWPSSAACSSNGRWATGAPWIPAPPGCSRSFSGRRPGSSPSSLVRTASGPYVLEEAATPDELQAAVAQGQLERLLVRPAEMQARLAGRRVEDDTP